MYFAVLGSNKCKKETFYNKSRLFYIDLFYIKFIYVLFQKYLKGNKMEKETNSIQLLKYVNVAAFFALIGFGYAISVTVS